MKKFLITAVVMLFGFLSSAQAEMKIGVTAKAGGFEVDDASETFSGSHSSGSAVGDVTVKASAEGDEAEGAFIYGSVFLEKQVNEKFSLGIDYVPMAMESETTENTVNHQAPGTGNDAQGTNTVQVDFEDLTTIYALLHANDNVYLKVGYMEVDVQTNESLATGGAYGNTTLEGYTVGLGYDHDMDSGVFVRLEATYMDLEGATLTNANDSTKGVHADGIVGYGAGISIGRAF